MTDHDLNVFPACSLVERSVLAVFGSDLGAQGDLAASVLNFFGLSLIQANPSLLWEAQRTKYGQEINLFPSRRSLTRVRLALK